MTPEEAREIDRLEFEADCRAARERAYALIAERRASSTEPESKSKAQNAPAEDRVIVRRSNAKRYPLDGTSRTIVEWSAICGHSVATLHYRMKTGMTFEQAVTTPKLTGSIPWQEQVSAPAEPGVVQNFAPSTGTGAGSTTQDFP